MTTAVRRVDGDAAVADVVPHVSGFGSVTDAIASSRLGFLRSTDPTLGFGGGLLCAAGR